MNERLPYEDELSRGLNDLPIPDASGAWEDMKRRLDEEERKRRIIPPLFFRSCLAIAGLGLLFAGLVMFGPEKGAESGERGAEEKMETRYKKQETSLERETETEREREREENTVEIGESGKRSVVGGQEINRPGSEIEGQIILTPGKPSANINTAKKGTLNTVSRNRKKTSSENSNSENSLSKTSINKINTASGNKQSVDIDPRSTISKDVDPGKKNSSPTNSPDSTLRTPQSEQRVPRTVIKDTLVAAVSLDKESQNGDTVAVAKIDSAKKKKFSVSGGIALQQGIPVNGQSTVPYNYFGRKASLSDYIPSVYLRLHYGKLFLQGEARYGAPQSVKEVSFARKTTVDSSSNNFNEKTSRLKKTYYHQLPLSLNYNITKSISLGTGFSYNIFQGAVTEEITRTYNASGTQNVKSQIQNIKGFKDSFLYKSQLQWILHTEYSWKRLAIGLRFTYDLEPYIRYTLPSGEIKDEKNQTLQAILRFRIF